MSHPSYSSQVTVEEATQKATQMNIMFMETSAKAGHNVKSLFKKIAMSLPGMDNNVQADAQNASMYSTLLFGLGLRHSRNRRDNCSDAYCSGSLTVQLLTRPPTSPGSLCLPLVTLYTGIFVSDISIVCHNPSTGSPKCYYLP